MPATAGKQVQGIVHLLLLYPCIRISCFNCTQPLGHTATINIYMFFYYLQLSNSSSLSQYHSSKFSHLWKRFAFVASVLSETCHAPIHWMSALIDRPTSRPVDKKALSSSHSSILVYHICAWSLYIKRAEPTFKKSTSWNFMSIRVLVEAQKSNGR